LTIASSAQLNRPDAATALIKVIAMPTVSAGGMESRRSGFLPLSLIQPVSINAFYRNFIQHPRPA
jgi:hypothetical protein